MATIGEGRTMGDEIGTEGGYAHDDSARGSTIIRYAHREGEGLLGDERVTS